MEIIIFIIGALPLILLLTWFILYTNNVFYLWYKGWDPKKVRIIEYGYATIFMVKEDDNDS